MSAQGCSSGGGCSCSICSAGKVGICRDSLIMTMGQWAAIFLILTTAIIILFFKTNTDPLTIGIILLKISHNLDNLKIIIILTLVGAGFGVIAFYSCQW
jgi:hypothetical protein